MELGEEQKQAFLEIISFIKSDQNSFSLTGAAGTGKSFLISKISSIGKSNLTHNL